MSDQTTHFGFRDVPVADKTRLVGEVFRSVAPKYDLMNDLMSMGVHRLWKRDFIGTAGLRKGDVVLDLASGTGDIARLLAEAVGEGGQVTATDINPAMLSLGRDRLTDEGLLANLRYALANAEFLPFPDRSFDQVTIAFGLRNVTDKALALREMHRVLKVGGRASILEFSAVQSDLLKPMYELYSFEVLPRLGAAVAGDADSYRYLAESIRKHPDQETLAAMMREAGFERVSCRNLTGGIVAIHAGYRV